MPAPRDSSGSGSLGCALNDMALLDILGCIKADEGWVPHAYHDTEGFLTIGYGFLIDSARGGELPREVADAWLLHIVERDQRALARQLRWYPDAPEGIRVALANMCYQLGIKGLLGFRRMLAAIDAGDYGLAYHEALDSKWAAQTPARAKRIAEMIRDA